MNLEKWSLIAEITGGVAIVISVVILIVEVRGNTAAIRAASAQSITDATVDVLTLMASDGELSALRVAGDQTIREPLDPASADSDRWRYFFYNRQHWMRFQNVYLQARSGALDPAVWDTYERVVCTDMTNTNWPGINATWPDHRNVLDPEFVDLVESCPGL